MTEPSVDTPHLQTHNSDSPPILKSWERLYLFVLGELALLIISFYAFSKFFR